MTVYWELYLLSNKQRGVRFYVPIFAPPGMGCNYFYVRIATVSISCNKIIPISFNDYINGMIGKELTDYFYVDDNTVCITGMLRYYSVELDRPYLTLYNDVERGYVITEVDINGSSCCGKVYTGPE